MRRMISAVLIAMLLAIAVPREARGGGAATAVALGLASFVVFNHLVAGLAYAATAPYREPTVLHAPPAVYAAPAVVYASPPVAYATPVVAYAAPPVTYAAPRVVYTTPTATLAPPAATPAPPRVVYYPHGRYELRGDGVRTAYHWVWIPAPSPPPTPAPR